MNENILKQAKIEKIRRLCKKDPIYFIENFVKTFDPRMRENKYLPFKLYDFQKEFILELKSAYENKHDLIIDKSRDMGCTWCVLAFLYWCWYFVPSFQCLVGSKKEEDVDNAGLPKTLFGKLDIIRKMLPDFFRFKSFIIGKHRTHLKMINPENRAVISGESSNQDFSVSGRFEIILLDEFSKWDNDEKVFMQTADSSPCRIFLGTPNGMGNEFGNIRFGGYTKHLEYHWRLHPEKGKEAWFDEDQNKWRSPWYDNEVQRRLNSADSSAKNIAQELDICYLQSGDPVFPDRYLKLCKLETEHPIINENYAMGVDVSEGIEGNDDQSIDVIAKETGEQVFSWEGKMPIDDFSDFCVKVALYYNMALMNIESNTGLAVITRVAKVYPNLYTQMRYGYKGIQSTQRLGFSTNVSTKEPLILELQAALVSGTIKVTHAKTIEQLSYYQIIESDSSFNRKKYGAPKGKHDDKVMSLALAWECAKQTQKALSYRQLREKAKKKKTKRQFKVSRVCGY